MSSADVQAEPGPSRQPTVSTEAEEQAAEAGFIADRALASTVPQHPQGATSINGESAVDGVKVPASSSAQADGTSSTTQPENQEPAAPKDPNALPDDACETLYIQNLNEKVQIPVMKQTLASLFKPYRPVLPVVAHRNVRMRGQAFVSFSDKESANRARKDVSEFPLYGKAMQISFARSRQDAVVRKLDGEEKLEEHKKHRLEEKKRKRRDNPLRRKAAAKLRSGEESGAPAPSKKTRLQVPDEYLPPNNVLFIQNLPDGTTSDDLREVFELHAGLVEIRTIPAKKDIAFVEYADEAAATLAKDALHNFKIDGETKMKVTYAKK